MGSGSRSGEPERRTHRGLASLEKEEEGLRGGLKVVLQFMPTKMDQVNRKHMRKVFRVGEAGEELSPGMANIT